MKKILSYLRGREPIVLVAALIIVTGGLGFVWISDEVFEGSTDAFDRRAVSVLRNPNDLSQPIGPPWMKEVGRDITALGSVSILLIVIVAAAGFLGVNRNFRRMWVLLISTLGGVGISNLLKNAFDRTRPDIVPHLTEVYTSSFPSGHSMMSAVVYLSLAVLIVPVLPKFSLRLFVFFVAISVTVLVGVSRIYLGVHYPTDVLAGWVAGLVWALACWLIDRATKTVVDEATNPPVSSAKKDSLPRPLRRD